MLNYLNTNYVFLDKLTLNTNYVFLDKLTFNTNYVFLDKLTFNDKNLKKILGIQYKMLNHSLNTFARVCTDIFVSWF